MGIWLTANIVDPPVAGDVENHQLVKLITEDTVPDLQNAINAYLLALENPALPPFFLQDVAYFWSEKSPVNKHGALIRFTSYGGSGGTPP